LALNQDLGYPNVARWYKHIKSYESEFPTLSGSSNAGQPFTGESAAAPAAAAGGDDEDEVDLFASDDENDAAAEKLKEERIAAYNEKKANKPKTVAKVRRFRILMLLQVVDRFFSPLLL
jgi:elongation factor 1-beta